MFKNNHILKFSALYFAAYLFSNPAGATDTPLWKQVNQWDVRVDKTLDYGCFLVAFYEEGTAFRIGIDASNGTGYFILANHNWRSIEQGKEYELRVRFDNEPPWKAIATGIVIGNDELALHAYFNTTEFFKEFAIKHIIEINYSNKSIARLKLNNSYKALEELLNCQKAMREVTSNKHKLAPSNSSDPFAD